MIVNKFKGKCFQPACGIAVPAGEGYLFGDKVLCGPHGATMLDAIKATADQAIQTLKHMDTDDGHDAYKDERVVRGTWGYGRNGRQYR